MAGPDPHEVEERPSAWASEGFTAHVQPWGPVAAAADVVMQAEIATVVSWGRAVPAPRFRLPARAPS
ncbi:hypothetical protein ACFVH9_19335 [Streptomyces hirsutus]|uniref:hypothetical protein n=1 Tax=Streptomyces hirsutus TaxID=35620 RepID=UPI0036279A44